MTGIENFHNFFSLPKDHEVKWNLSSIERWIANISIRIHSVPVLIGGPDWQKDREFDEASEGGNLFREKV